MLLARKFASDFAERYRTAPIPFADSGRMALSHYSWPGNVRQLKNVIEQISLFESGKEIDSEIISAYLPANATVYAPTLSSARTRSYDNEREMIFNMIFRLQNQIDELKDRLGDNHPKLVEAFVDVKESPGHEEASVIDNDEPMPTALVNISDSPAVPKLVDPDEPHSLEEKERQAIEAALERNSGRRKIAARELGISERTLYRKIKEYGLDQ